MTSTIHDTDIAIIEGGYDAFERGDVAGALARFAPDIVWTTPASVPGGGVYRGPAEIGAFFAGLPERWAELHLDRTAHLADGGRVVVLGRFRGSAVATGAAIDSPFVHVWEVRDGLAVRLDEYLDSAVLAAAFGATVS